MKRSTIAGAKSAEVKFRCSDVNNPEASFQAPQVSETRTYRFKSRVTDKKGADSLPAYVDITVEP